MKLHLIILLSLFVGCYTSDPTPKKAVQRKEWPQKCEMCGSEWLVTPNNPNEIVPSTVEWCFNDGNYCETGFQLILKRNHVLLFELKDVELEFLNHCLNCKGCRCAAFDPDEWHKITDKLEE